MKRVSEGMIWAAVVLALLSMVYTNIVDRGNRRLWEAQIELNGTFSGWVMRGVHARQDE